MLIYLTIGCVSAGIAGVVVYLLCLGKLSIAKIELKAREDALDRARHEYDETLKKAEDRFKSLAQSVLEERSAKLQSEGEKGMRGIADGLRICIKDFRDRIEQINSETAERNVKLDAQILGLVDQTNTVSAQANKLADAIRGEAQMTGAWGELQLRRVLELGGLEETIDYTYQESFTAPGSDRKNQRTDVLVKMTDGRWMVIDAKTTLAAYVDLAQSGTSDERRDARRRIVGSVLKHVEELKTAAYHRNIEQVTGKKLLKTMLMYIPFDEVYLLAMKAEVVVGGERKLLRDYARENDIVFINATGLLPVVRMLADFWSVAKADRKAMKIKEAAEALVEKFRVFLEAEDGFMRLGSQLSTAIACYNESVKRLASGPGNIMKRVSDLKDMGVNVDTLPAAETVEAKRVDASS